MIKITHLKTLYPSIEEVKIEQLNRVDKNTGKILLDLLIYYRVQKKLMKYRLTVRNFCIFFLHNQFPFGQNYFC